MLKISARKGVEKHFLIREHRLCGGIVFTTVFF